MWAFREQATTGRACRRRALLTSRMDAGFHARFGWLERVRGAWMRATNDGALDTTRALLAPGANRRCSVALCARFAHHSRPTQLPLCVRMKRFSSHTRARPSDQATLRRPFPPMRGRRHYSRVCKAPREEIPAFLAVRCAVKEADYFSRVRAVFSMGGNPPGERSLRLLLICDEAGK